MVMEGDIPHFQAPACVAKKPSLPSVGLKRFQDFGVLDPAIKLGEVVLDCKCSHS